MTKYIGLDLSLTSPGFAIIEVEDRVPRLIATTSVKTTAKENIGSRLAKIQNTLVTFLRDNEITPKDTFIKEQSFSRFAKETQAIFMTVGVVHLTLKNIEIENVHATSIKKNVAGSGKASKDEVANAVKKQLNLPPEYEFENSDLSDACGVVLCYLWQNKLID